jgi:hypothetical protein
MKCETSSERAFWFLAAATQRFMFLPPAEENCLESDDMTQIA